MRKFIGLTAVSAVVIVTACSINVKKDEQGQDKNVDINTPFGGIHVNENADVRDTGLPVYAGSRQKKKDDSGDEKSANVNISTSAFGLKVVAVEYESDAAPGKLVAYYKNELKRYGNVLECHTEGGHDTYERLFPRDGSAYWELRGFAWWSGWRFLGYVVIPMLVLACLPGERLPQ